MSVFSQPVTDYERFDPREVIAAAPDFFAQAFGHSLPGRTRHPLAGSLDMGTIAYAYGVTNGRPINAGPASNNMVVVSQGAATNGFTKLLRDATAPIVLRAYRAAQQHPFAAVLFMDDLKPQAIYGIDGGHALDLVPELAKIPRRRAFAPDAGYGVARMGTYSQILELTRDDLLSNDTASLKNILTGAGGLAAQVEAGLLAAEIEAPTDLSDGLVLDATNVLSEALSSESLGTAFGKLRAQGATGRPLNIAPRHLVVEPGLELAARRLVRDADMGATVQVSVLPELASGRWLVLGDPEQAPSLTLFKLADSSINYVVQRSFKNDGVDMSVGTDAGAGFLSRIGFVRGGA